MIDPSQTQAAAWSARQDQEKRINALIKNGVTFSLYGPPGLGKSYCLRNLLSSANVPYIEVSCLLYSNKAVLIKGICREMVDKYLLPIAETTSFFTFKQNLTKLVEDRESKQISSDHPVFYILLDDFHHFKAASSKIIKKLLSIEQTPIVRGSGGKLLRLGIILVSHMPISGIFSEQQNFGEDIIPKIRLQSYNAVETSDIIHRFLQNEILPGRAASEEEKSLFKELGEEIARDIVQTIGLVTNDLGRLMYLAEILYTLLMEPVRLNPKKYIASPALLMTSRPDTYVQATKLLLNDPFAHYRSIEDLKVKMALRASDPQMEGQDSLNSIAAFLNLTKVPAILVIACYIGNRNPEKTDKRIFKSSGAKTRLTSKGMQLETDEAKQKVLQKLSLQRWIALTQVLLSCSEDKGEEIETFDQTTDFYSQIVMLEQQGFVSKQMNVKDPLNKSKYSCKASFEIVKSLSEKFSLKLNEFLIE
jgi:hypothetical protein